MSRRITERRLVDVLMAFFRTSHVVEREVAHYEKSIDLAAIPFDSDELWTIEAKTENWARALAQAVVNLSAGERSYIAIFSENVHRVPTEELATMGIGLISVGTKWGEVEVLRAAERSPYTNRLAKQRICRRLTERAN